MVHAGLCKLQSLQNILIIRKFWSFVQIGTRLFFCRIRWKEMEASHVSCAEPNHTVIHYLILMQWPQYVRYYQQMMIICGYTLHLTGKIYRRVLIFYYPS